MSADAIEGPRPLTPAELADAVREMTVQPDLDEVSPWDRPLSADAPLGPRSLVPEELAADPHETTVPSDDAMADEADVGRPVAWEPPIGADGPDGPSLSTPEAPEPETDSQPDVSTRDQSTSAGAIDGARPLTPEELAGVVRTLREFKHWSQETLAALSGLSLSAVQRVEEQGSADLDTCCALAQAFQFEDVHAFSKPYSAPSPDEIAHAKEQFEREHIDLAARVATSGSELGHLFEVATVDHAAPAMKLTEEATDAFTALVECLHAHREAAERCAEPDKLERYAEIQRYLDVLAVAGVVLCYARWDTKLPGQAAAVTVAYVSAYPIGHEPERLIVPRRIRVSS